MVLQCDNDKFSHLSIDLEKELLRYIINIDGEKYYSKIKISEIIYQTKYNENDTIYSLLQTSILSYESDIVKYKSLEDSVYESYIYFEDLFHKESNSNEYSNRSVFYTFTGSTTEEINIGYELIDEVFHYSLLSETGLHYGVRNNTNGIKYIYIVDTYLYQSNVYISKIKVWEILFDYTNTIESSSNVNVDLNIAKSYDAFVEGNSSGGKITVAPEGYAYISLKSISSKLSVSNYSYIRKYKIGYTNEQVSSPAYIQTINNLFGFFVPYYKTLSSIVNKTNNISDNMNQINFDDNLLEYEFTNGENNLKEIGFELDSSDLGIGIFNDEYLQNYSFFQDIMISNVPNYLIDVNMEIQIVPLYDQEEVLCFNSNLEIQNNYNCNHTITCTDDNTGIHIVSCNYCGYSYYEEHSISYVNQGELGHSLNCDFCNYSMLETHNMKIVNNGNKCYECNFFENTIFEYIPNYDGKTHTIKSGTLSKTENCLGLVGSDGNSYCIKCGQNMSGIIINSVITYKNEEEENE